MKILVLSGIGILRPVFDLENSEELPAKVIQDCSQKTIIFNYSIQRNP